MPTLEVVSSVRIKSFVLVLIVVSPPVVIENSVVVIPVSNFSIINFPGAVVGLFIVIILAPPV